MSRPALYPIGLWMVWTIGLPVVLIVLSITLVLLIDEEILLFDGRSFWWLGGAALPAGTLFFYGLLRRRAALPRFTSQNLAPLLTEQLHPAKQALRAGMIITAVSAIAAGIIGPRWGVYLDQQKVRGVDIVVALDVSRSMLARDVEPNRLTRAKKEILQQLIERPAFAHANRMALLAFAGSTSLKLPLTTDHAAFRNKLGGIGIGSAPRGGTAIAQAISKAVDLFAKSPEQATKMILVFTDGEDHEGEPVEAAKRAWEQRGIQVYTIGVGDADLTAGAQVPMSAGAGAKPLLHDGQIVFSKLDVEGMSHIAQVGGGTYTSIAQFRHLVTAIAGVRRILLSTEERIRHRPRYQWFLVVALILLGVEPMIRDRSTRGSSVPQRVWQEEMAQ